MDVEQLTQEVKTLKTRFNDLVELLQSCNLKAEVDLTYLMEENDDEFSDIEEFEEDLNNE